MIFIKSPSQIEKMRKAGDIIKGLWDLFEKEVKPGVTTKHLDKLAYNYISSHNAKPSFLGYGGFPGTICASINEQVVH